MDQIQIDHFVINLIENVSFLNPESLTAQFNTFNRYKAIWRLWEMPSMVWRKL